MTVQARARSGAAVPVRLHEVSRSHAGRLALAPLTLSVEAGAVCAVTGANGSGKTTLLRVVAGLLTPSAGRRSVESPALYLSSRAGARRQQRVRDAVAVAAALAGRRTDPLDALDAVGLAAEATRMAGTLSSGERARLSLALALAAEPRVACLDEPTEPLDAEGRRLAADAVARLAGGGCAVLVATHDLDALGQHVDARVHLHHGEVAEP